MEARPIERKDIRAWRTADELYAVRRQDGTTFLQCTKRTPDDPYETSKVYRIPTESRFVGYGKSEPTDYTECFASLWQDCIRTIGELLRVGDTLRIIWKPDCYSNGYTRKQNGYSQTYLHADGVDLEIDRPDKSARGFKRLHFTIGMSICPDNSARMIRGLHYHKPIGAGETAD